MVAVPVPPVNALTEKTAAAEQSLIMSVEAVGTESDPFRSTERSAVAVAIEAFVVNVGEFSSVVRMAKMSLPSRGEGIVVVLTVGDHVAAL
jgi:hypothetical protein